MTRLYGIKNCDTVKKARAWLDMRKISYEFHDFRLDGLTADQVDAWLRDLGVKTLINKSSTTWKQLSPEQQAIALGGQATALILAFPTLIKRPVLTQGESITLGFKPEQYERIFAH